MKNKDNPSNKARPRTPSLPRMFVDDIRSTRFGRDYWKELKELYYFYLDEDSRNRLASMGRLRRAFLIIGWLVKSLLLKLSPGRRLVLLVAIILTFVLGNTSFVISGWGFSAWAFSGPGGAPLCRQDHWWASGR